MTPSSSAKPSTTTRFSARLNSREQHDRQRDHHPRELDLANEVLAVDDAAHGARGGFGEEGEQHDRAEQLRAVVLLPGCVLAVDLRDLGEEHVQHAEQQQRAHELPQVAEHRAEEAQLEFVAGDVVGEVPEARPVVGQRPRALDRPAEARVGRRLASSSLHLSARPPPGRVRRSTSTGTSTSPPMAPAPVTTNEKAPSKRSIRSRPVPRCASVSSGL